MNILDILLSAPREVYSHAFLTEICTDYQISASGGKAPDVFQILDRAKGRHREASESLGLALSNTGDPEAAFAELCATGPEAAARRHAELVAAAQ